MTIRLQILFLLIPIMGNAQNLIRCNDSISYFVNQNENFYCSIKLKGKVSMTSLNKVIFFDSQSLQALLIEEKYYLLNGKEDTAILKNYIISESNFYAKSFKEDIKTMMIPVEISEYKKALIWYFDIPENIIKQGNPRPIYGIKQVFISVIVDNYIYSIATTQFNNQNLDTILKLLTNLTRTINYHKGDFQPKIFCDN